MRRVSIRVTLLVSILCTVVAPLPGPAQTIPVGLIADRVAYDRQSGILEAVGNVEMFYDGQVLRATRVIYDEPANEVRATGPLVLTDRDGNVFLADAAALTPDLAEGLIEGARLLVAGQLQVAASELRRTTGRYTTLDNTIASSCTICAQSPTPTWALRASRVVRDAETRRIYFEHATFDLFGVPVGYLPRLSIPEPGVGRASGVLVPELRQSDILGFGVRVPYYHVLGPSADATITPFVTTGGAALIEGEYRQRFDGGGFDISGVVALDDGGAGNGLGQRGVLRARGDFDLPREFAGRFDVNVTTDDSFLQQFDYSDADRLTNILTIGRTRAHDHAEASVIAFQSLRAGEDTRRVPVVLPDIRYRRALRDPVAGGNVSFDLQALGILRDLGANMLRGGGGVDWRRNWTLPQGVLASATGFASADLYRAWEDDDVAGTLLLRSVPGASVETRWPLARFNRDVVHVVEPIGQLAYSRSIGDDALPNEDSVLPEFDATNLFSLDRFPGGDRRETGLRANLGVSYTRFDPAGWTAGLTLGRVLRDTATAGFSDGVGLAGRSSDYVASLSLGFSPTFALVNRSLFDDDLAFRRNEFAMSFSSDDLGFRFAHIHMVEDNSNAVLGPQPKTNEFAVEARYQLHRNWQVRGNWRYDAENDSKIRTGGGLTYANECAEFDLSLSRRYTSSSNLQPSTSIGFSLRLAGLGGSENMQGRSSCGAL